MLHFWVASKYWELKKIAINTFRVLKNTCIHKNLILNHVFTPSFTSPCLPIDSSSSFLHSLPEYWVPQALSCSLSIFKGSVHLFLLYTGLWSKYAHALVMISKAGLWKIRQNYAKQSQKWEVNYVKKKKIEDGLYSSSWKPDRVDKKENDRLLIDWSLT